MTVLQRSLAAVVGLGLVLGATEARAEEPVPAEARELATRGNDLYKRGDYRGAIGAFKEAYVLAPAALLLFNLAQAYRMAGDCADSAYMYQRFLASNPAPEQRDVAMTHHAAMQRCAAGASLGIPVAGATVQSPLASFAGSGRLEDRPHPPGKRMQGVGIGVTIAGALALVGGAVEGYRAAAAASDVEAAYAMGGTWADVAPLDERGRHAQTAERWLLIGGGAAVATGVVLYLVGKRAEHRHAVTPLVAATPGGAAIGAAWRF